MDNAQTTYYRLSNIPNNNGSFEYTIIEKFDDGHCIAKVTRQNGYSKQVVKAFKSRGVVDVQPVKVVQERLF